MGFFCEWSHSCFIFIDIRYRYTSPIHNFALEHVESSFSEVLINNNTNKGYFNNFIDHHQSTNA